MDKNYKKEEENDVGAECRHDMRPSIQLPSVSGVDSKLGLTMVRPGLQSSAREPTERDSLPATKIYPR